MRTNARIIEDLVENRPTQIHKSSTTFTEDDIKMLMEAAQKEVLLWCKIRHLLIPDITPDADEWLYRMINSNPDFLP